MYWQIGTKQLQCKASLEYDYKEQASLEGQDTISPSNNDSWARGIERMLPRGAECPWEHICHALWR